MNQNLNRTIQDIRIFKKNYCNKKYSFIISNIMTAIMKSAGRTRTVQYVNMMVPQDNHDKCVLSLIIYHIYQAIRCIYFLTNTVYNSPLSPGPKVHQYNLQSYWKFHVCWRGNSSYHVTWRERNQVVTVPY